MPQEYPVAAITGHRPDKLFGYDLRDPRYNQLRGRIQYALLKFNCVELYTGMALGIDQLAALAVLDLKDQGRSIKLNAAIPCQNQGARWTPESKLLYQAILSKCDRKILVTDAPYAPKLMQDRNMYMANHADLVIAVWDGSNGGTGNCVAYARKTGKPVWRIHPKDPNIQGWL